MGARGRAKQPQKLLEAKGYAKPSRKRAEVMVGDKITTLDQVDALCDYTLLTPRAQKIFIQRCQWLIGLKVLEASYLDTVLLYAQNYDMALRCAEDINTKGWFVPMYDEAGMLKGYAENPHIKTFDKICKTLGSYSKELFMTPASRMRMQIENESKKADIMDVSAEVIEI